MEQKKIPLELIVLNEDNPRQITREKLDRLIESLLVFPKMLELRPVVLDDNNIALGGNMRTRGLKEIRGYTTEQLTECMERQQKYNNMTPFEQGQLLEFWLAWQKKPVVPYMEANDLTDEERNEFIVKDNVGFGMWDYDMLANQYDETLLDEWGVDVWQNDGDDDGDGSGSGDKKGSLQERFVVPPFSILDTRKGYWKERKQVWRELIGDAGESREGTLADGDTNVMASINSGVSLFDPVLAEALCKWFTPNAGAKIFDCFAGDTQKGFVFGHCGYEFTGIELRQEQIDVNNSVLANFNLPVKYICDDGQNVAKHIKKTSQDLLFSCPPYFDLEVYSDKPNDASNQSSYDGFLEILDNALTSSIGCLKDDRFAVIVVGDVRDSKTGFYHSITGDVKDIFKRNGMLLYNELIIVEAIGTLPQRVGRYMTNRKIGKCHQNVLVFYKGNPANIKDTFPAIDYTDDDVQKFDEANKEE